MQLLLIVSVAIFAIETVPLVDSSRAQPGMAEPLSTRMTPDARRAGKSFNSASHFNVRCPRPEDIHPCICIEIMKGMETEFVEEETVSETSDNSTIEIAMKEEIVRSQPHPDTIETLVFCRNIRNLEVLKEAVKGFNGHRVDHFVLDSCKLPPFPTNLFAKIDILWMEIVNTTIVLKHSFLNCAADCL